MDKAVSVVSCSKKMQLVLVACKLGRVVYKEWWTKCFNGGYGNNKSLKNVNFKSLKEGDLNAEIGVFLLALFSVEEHLEQCPTRAKL